MSSATKLVEKAMNSTPAVTTKAPKQAKKTVNVQQKQGKVKTYKIDPNKRLTSGIVDQILLIDSLKPVREGLVDTLKTQMLSTESKYADGDRGTATLAQTTDATEIDARKFYNLFKSGKIKEKDFLACISVGKTQATKILGKDQIAKISNPLPAREPSLTVKTKDEAPPLKLCNVLERLAPVVTEFEKGLNEVPVEKATPAAE